MKYAFSSKFDFLLQIRKKEKVFSNRCNKPKCKKKELVPLICDTCKLNFCLTHRHPADHDCQGPKKPSNRAADALLLRELHQLSQVNQKYLNSFLVHFVNLRDNKLKGEGVLVDNKLVEIDKDCQQQLLQQSTDSLGEAQLQVRDEKRNSGILLKRVFYCSPTCTTYQCMTLFGCTTLDIS